VDPLEPQSGASRNRSEEVESFAENVFRPGSIPHERLRSRFFGGTGLRRTPARRGLHSTPAGRGFPEGRRQPLSSARG
jgi:hypothetical protein